MDHQLCLQSIRFLDSGDCLLREEVQNYLSAVFSGGTFPPFHFSIPAEWRENYCQVMEVPGIPLIEEDVARLQGVLFRSAWYVGGRLYTAAVKRFGLLHRLDRGRVLKLNKSGKVWAYRVKFSGCSVTDVPVQLHGTSFPVGEAVPFLYGPLVVEEFNNLCREGLVELVQRVPGGERSWLISGPVGKYKMGDLDTCRVKYKAGNEQVKLDFLDPSTIKSFSLKVK